MKRLAQVVALGLVVVVAIVFARALRLRPAPPEASAAPRLAVDTGAVAGQLAAAIAVPTVSFDVAGPAPETLAALRAHLAASFPRVFSQLPREEIAGGALLVTWAGSDATLAPIVLMAHQDVVPVPESSLAAWSQPPFAGVLAGGFVWGRGALDDKGPLVTLLAAVDGLLERRFAPRRTVLLAFGHDEEVGGRGAAAIAERLAALGVRPAMVLDEGMPIGRGLVPGVARPVALVGVAEKGYASFELVVEAEGGHSSMPRRETAISILAAALTRLTAEPLPARPGASIWATLAAVAPAADFKTRLALANLWLFRPLVARQLAASPVTDAGLRTTLAPTILDAGVKENVLAARARAVVNLRLLPGDSVLWAESEIRRRVADERVRLAATGGGIASEASPVSATDGWGYQRIARSVRDVMPEAVVAPGLMVGATDSRHFTALSDQVFRFAPIELGPDDPARFHGVDERLSIDNLERAVRIYTHLLENAAG